MGGGGGGGGGGVMVTMTMSPRCGEHSRDVAEQEIGSVGVRKGCDALNMESESRRKVFNTLWNSMNSKTLRRLRCSSPVLVSRLCV